MKKLVARSQQPVAKSAKRFGFFKLQAPGFRLQAGFTLIELMVSVALFTIVMLVAVGALLSLVEANRKARALESVINNLNITLDGMVRAIRMGSTYVCGDDDIPLDYATAGANCDGDTEFSFAPYGSDNDNNAERFVYTFANGQLFRSTDGGATTAAVTAPEVVITEMNFYVVGTIVRDVIQPKVVMVIKGVAGPSEKTQSTFYIQATAVQRTLDI